MARLRGDFEAYVDARGRAWERYAYALTADADRAQDLLQTVLLKAFRQWSRIVAAEHPDAYVRRMITHAFLDQRRRRGSAEVPAEGAAVDGLAPDPAVGVIERDELRRALNALTPQQRTVLVLRHVEGLDDDQIAAVLGCAVTTVRTHASRGRDRFRLAFAGRADSVAGTAELADPGPPRDGTRHQPGGRPDPVSQPPRLSDADPSRPSPAVGVFSTHSTRPAGPTLRGGASSATEQEQ